MHRIIRSLGMNVVQLGVILTLLSFLDCGTSSSYPSKHLLLGTSDLIAAAGYPCEEHFAVTPDGYILRLFRIPPRNNRTAVPVLFAHGMTAASDIYVLQGRGKDLAFILHDEGFDVWFFDVRGNIYSRNHTHLSPEKPQFWQFSLHEIGRYDVTTSIDYALKVAQKERLFFVGHSMGATIFFVAMADQPKYNDKIIAFAGLAPTVLPDPNHKPLLWDAALLAVKAFVKERVWELFRRDRIGVSPLYSYLFCSKSTPLIQDLCVDNAFFWCGLNYKFLSRKVVPTLISHIPSGLGTLQFLHYTQYIDDGIFRRLNYGKEGNIRNYGTEDPPEYNVSLVTAPVAMYYSKNDYLTIDTGVELTMAALPNVIYARKYLKYNHGDFALSRFAWKDVYADMINLFKSRLLLELK